eukprot:2678465-Prymnesium_polylepis.2
MGKARKAAPPQPAASTPASTAASHHDPSATDLALHRLLARALDDYCDDDARAEDLVPSQPGFLLQLDEFISPSECARLVAATDAAHLQPSTEADRRPRKGEAFLDRETVAFVEPALADALWARLRPHLPDVPRASRVVATPCGFHGDGRGRSGRGREGVGGQLKFYRYCRGHRFGSHVDQSWRGEPPGYETEYTMLVRAHRV